MRKFLLAAATVCLPAMIIGLRWNSAPFFSVQKYSLIHTGTLSADYLSSIDTALKNLFQTNRSAHTIIEQMHQLFPLLDKIVISYRPTTVHITVTAPKPLCCINDTSIFTADAQLFPKSDFSAHILEKIPSITIAPQWITPASSYLVALLDELPSDFRDHYNLELINQYYMRWTDKKNLKFTIVAHATQKKIPELLAQCEMVKKNIDEKKGFNKAAAWVADTRFTDYIIAYKT